MTRTGRPARTSPVEVACQIMRARRQLGELLGREKAAATIGGLKPFLRAWMAERLETNPLSAALAIVHDAENDGQPLGPVITNALVVAAGELCPLNNNANEARST